MDVQTTGRLLIFSLFKRQKMIWQIILTILATVILGSLLLPPSYEASTTLLVRGRTNQDLLTPSARVDNSRTVMLNPLDEINSEIEIIKSRPVLESVVKTLKLHDRPPTLETGFFGNVRNLSRWALRLPGWFFTTIAPESMIIRLKYRDRDPLMAAKIVNLITEDYLRQHLVINTNQGQSSFFAEQIDTVKSQLKDLQDKLVKIKEETGLLSFDEQSRLLLKQLDTFETARSNLHKDIINIQAKIGKIADIRKTKPNLLIPLPEIAQDVQIQDLENKLINMRYQLNSVTQRYTDSSRQVETATSQIKDLNSQIKKQVSVILERELARLKALEAEKQGVDDTILSLKMQIEKLPAQEVALSNLTREIETKQETLAVLWKKYQDSIIAQNTDERLENVKVVSFANVPLRPVSPKLWLNTLLGLLLAIVVSFSIAFFLTHWDDTINLPEDVERYLNLPVCASIPEL